MIRLAQANKDNEARILILKSAGPLMLKWQAALEENIELPHLSG